MFVLAYVLWDAVSQGTEDEVGVETVGHIVSKVKKQRD